MTRWSRIVHHETGKGLLVAIDHGLTAGGLAGMESSAQLTSWLRHPAITAVVAHKGMVAQLNESGCLLGKGVILQMNGMVSSAAQPNRKELLTSVDAALRLGVDAISLDLVFDGANDSRNLRMLGSIADQANAYGLPILVMVKCPQRATSTDDAVAVLRRAVRSIWELGADAVKVQRPDAFADIPRLLDGLHRDINVFFAGGPRSCDEEILTLLTLGLKAGAKGLCVGRNVFQNESPQRFLTALGGRLHQDTDTLAFAR
jgi:class I fructose-bisphosphate aldolase/fructose-bisphosphate aldolase/2-amino-3,7-dideoxy-D-threo-hept-6-ulosonate synthase